MAELNLGTSMSADDYLELVTAVNKRRNKSNAMLRGLGAIAGVTPLILFVAHHPHYRTSTQTIY